MAQRSYLELQPTQKDELFGNLGFVLGQLQGDGGRALLVFVFAVFFLCLTPVFFRLVEMVLGRFEQFSAALTSAVNAS